MTTEILPVIFKIVDSRVYKRYDFQMQRGSNVHFAWIGTTNLKYLYGAWPVAELFDQVAGPLPVASANECACFTKCQHKSFKIFFSTLKDWNNHVIVRKEWNFYWDITTKQGLIGQKQFQPDMWDLKSSGSWRGCEMW